MSRRRVTLLIGAHAWCWDCTWKRAATTEPEVDQLRKDCWQHMNRKGHDVTFRTERSYRRQDSILSAGGRTVPA